MFDDLNHSESPSGPLQAQPSFDYDQAQSHFTLSQQAQTQAAFIQQSSKKNKKLFWIIGIVLVLALCACMGSLSTILNGSSRVVVPAHAVVSSVTSETTGTAEMQATATTLPTVSLTWTKTREFSGHGLKKTDTFTVAATWKLKYTCSGMGQGLNGLLSVLVYTADGSMQDMAINTTCKDGMTTSDESVLHQGGSVYLDINATGDWTLEVDEQN